MFCSKKRILFPNKFFKENTINQTTTSCFLFDTIFEATKNAIGTFFKNQIKWELFKFFCLEILIMVRPVT